MTALPLISRPGPIADWPDMSVLDQARADPDWRPLPFTQFVIKPHGRCNLSCDYCYIYELADQSWRLKPIAMSRETLHAAAARISEHLDLHRSGIRQVLFSFLGGEALLAGAEELDYAATVLEGAVPEGIEALFSVTTNGTLLDDPAMLEVLNKHDIGVTLSLDGARGAHDRHRVYANGRGSYDAVMTGVAALKAAAPEHRLRNVLCVVDIENDPIETYQALMALGVPRMDFLLPLSNWENPPPGWSADGSRTPYADWLIPVFDLWYGTVPLPGTVRLFESIIDLVLGGRSSTEAVGLGNFQSVTIDTDGAIEQVDALKSTFADAPATGLDVRRHTLDEAMLHPGVVARQRGVAALSPECLACSIHTLCGAGQFANRYRAGTGFLNPSVYCHDLRKLIVHIRDRVHADIERLGAQPPRLATETRQ